MEIFLIRHTSLQVAAGTCYGRSDLEPGPDFLQQAGKIRQLLPASIQWVYTSPSRRCSRLAGYLFPDHPIKTDPRLQELDFGDWEMRPWDQIPKKELEAWMQDFVQQPAKNGESYLQLYMRALAVFEQIYRQRGSSAIVTHSGVIRSLLAHFSAIPLKESFSAFKIPYAAVIRVHKNSLSAFELLC